MYENVSDLQLKAMGYDDQEIREIRARSKSPTLEFRKGVDDLPPIGVDASGEAYFQGPQSRQAVIRRLPTGEGFEYDKDGGVRILPKGDDIELLKAQARPPAGPGTASPVPAGSDALLEQDANRAIQDINRRFAERPTKETNEYVDRLTAGTRAKAIADTRQQRFKNENTRGLVDRNPQGARSTPLGQHPLDRERVPESRVAEPAAPPEDAVGAGEKAQWYANRMRPAPAGGAPSQSRLVVRGEEFNPNEEDPKMGWRTGSLKVSDAIARGDLAAARAMNERLPPSEQIPIPNRSVSAPVSPIGPSAEGLERIAESKRRKAAADQLITENAMANRASRRNRMGLVNPYISPEIRTLHRMGDDERDARTQMLNDKLALERERIASAQGIAEADRNLSREQIAANERIASENRKAAENRYSADTGWRKEQIASDERREAARMQAQRDERNKAMAAQLWQARAAAEAEHSKLSGIANQRPGDAVAEDRVRQARQRLADIDAQIKRYDQSYEPINPIEYSPATTGSVNTDRLWETFNRWVQTDPNTNRVTGLAGTPDQIVQGMIKELGTEWASNPENEIELRKMFSRIPGASDAYRIARDDEQWRDFWNRNTKIMVGPRDKSWAPSDYASDTSGKFIKPAIEIGKAIGGVMPGVGIPAYAADLWGWANRQP